MPSFRPPRLSLSRLIRPYRNFSTKLSTQSPVPNSGVLSNIKAVISGASRGIGLAIAQRFAAEGASCVLLGRQESTLKEALESLPPPASSEHEPKSEHSFRVGDVSNREFWVELGKDNEIKNTSILVNAAGTAHSSLLISTNPALVESIIQTNLMGTIWASQIMTKLFLRRKEGVIINISSLLALKGGTGSTAYAASKAGILGLTRSLAAEVGGSGIRVNAIVPGYIETSMTDAMSTKAHSHALSSIPLNRFGTATEVAHAAVFLATNEYATNCVLNLDGGLSAT